MFSAIRLTFFSKSKTEFGPCSLMPFEISVPEGSTPVTSWLHQINPILAKEVDATLNQYLAARLIQHSTSPYSSPLVVIPKKSGGVRTLSTTRNSTRSAASASCPSRAWTRFWTLWARDGCLPVRPGFFVPPNHRAQGHRSSNGVLHSHEPL